MFEILLTKRGLFVKVLIVGHNPFNKELPNGRTLYELFAKFNSNDIAELYLHPDQPTFDVCKKYYRITDLDVLKHFFSGKVGKEITKSDSVCSQSRNRVYAHGSKRKSYMVFLRNILWKYGRWFTKDLKKWVSSFQPDVIFFYSGNYIFSIDIALKLSKYYQIPIVSYIVDDYYFGNDLCGGVFGKINKALFDKKLNKLLDNRYNICLNDYMKERYAKEFKGNFSVLYTVSSLTAFECITPVKPIKMSFLGGIACDRYKSLIDIGRVIFEHHLPIEFTVYTRETREWLINPLKNAPGLTLHPALNYEEVIGTMNESHILVHVEGFSLEAQELVKYSLSTKIADTLSSNRCLLAYGPRNVASIEYLLDNKCAFVATDYTCLEKTLISLCDDINKINQNVVNALDVAKKNHRVEIATQKLNSVLQSAVSGSNVRE